MDFKIVFSIKHGSQFSVPSEKSSKTGNVRSKNHFKHFLFLQAAVFLSILIESVNGNKTSQATQLPPDLPPTQVPPPDLAQVPAPEKYISGRRQESLLDMTGKPVDQQGQAEALKRFSTVKKVITSRKRTTMWFESALDQCDYLALLCLRAYQTGKVCAKTVYYTYYTFKNYCMMDFANCAARYELWQVIHMGDCVNLKLRSSNLPMTEESSQEMQGFYVVDHDFGL
ncbi:hypothetical protein PYW08_009634 [Mythimna loreyi]|uniref:Uncharacterized protein n=1 Tax=Mythimna loreyi TaxID=667449 RepID=A0ACC2Q6J5_9NEOP|nr:hypothetical protein PYW08_009634 [Mythimna loreyi]